MAESEFQIEPLVYAFTALRTHFIHHAHVYVASDMFLYFKEGDPRAVVAPDVFVVLGAPKHTRMSYKLREEPKAPDFVLEVTSRNTRAEDQGRKREVYASLGVGEYWLFDPTGGLSRSAPAGVLAACRRVPTAGVRHPGERRVEPAQRSARARRGDRRRRSTVDSRPGERQGSPGPR